MMIGNDRFPAGRAVLDQDDDMLRERQRLRLGQALMGGTPGPVYSPLQGLANAATQMVGAWQAGKAADRLEERQAAMAEQLAAALSPQTLPDPGVAGPRVGTGARAQPTLDSVGTALMSSDFPALRDQGVRLRLQGLNAAGAEPPPARRSPEEMAETLFREGFAPRLR